MNYTISAILTAKDVGLRSTMARAAGDVKRFGSGMDSAGRTASKFASVIKAGLVGAGVALVAFFTNAISKAVAFETSMRNVNSIAGLSEKGFRQMSSAVLDLSTRVPQSATVLAEGLYDIASSGFQGAGALEVLEQSAIAATAGMTTTDVAAQAISASINAYGLSAADAADISDILFQTVNLGVVTFEELAGGLGNVVGGAAAAGVELDEVGAAIAAMTLSGLGAEESITSLNRLLEKIIKPSDELSAVFENLGYESGQAALDTNGLYGTMELLRSATGGQVTELLKLFPEIRAARGAFALMAAGGENYRRTFAGITDETARAGAAQRAYAEQSKALSVQWDLFVSSFNAFSIQVGTALLPALKSGLQGLTEFGQAAGDVMGQLGQAAAPMVRSLAQAFREVARVAGEVYKAVQPVVKVLAAAFAVAAIAGLRALAEALAAVAGVLADHPALIQAVAFAIGGLLLSNLLTAGAAAAKFAIQFRALLLMESLGPILSNIGGRLQMFGAAIANLRLGNLSGAVTGIGGAFRGLGGALKSIAPTAAMAAALLMIYRFQDSANKAKAAAQEMRQEIEADIDPMSLSSVRDGIQQFQAEMEAATAANDSYGGRLRRTLFEVGEVIPGLGNNADDTRVAMEEAGQAADEWRAHLSQLEHDIVTVANVTGASQEEVHRFLSELEGYDPTDTSQTTNDLANSFRDMSAAASGATPASEAVGGAMSTAGDLMSTAADKADAFKASLDALFGTMIGAQDAAIAYQVAIDDMTASFAEHGTSLNIDTEAGQANTQAIGEAASAALEHASAIVDSTGSMQEGVNTLQVYRQQLLDQMVASGLSRQAAEEYLATLGLTPENLQTQIELAGTAEATEAMGQVFDAFNQLDLETANPRVELDDLPFLDNAQAVGEFLRQVGQAAPEATVLLNDEQFVPTAQQVQTWAETYDASSPEAAALLNIIDPENNFRTLEAAAEGWEARHPTATADVDEGPAVGGILGATQYLNTFGSQTGTATADVNEQPAYGGILGATQYLNTFGTRTGTATADTDESPAQQAINRAQARLDAWNSARGVSDADANDSPAQGAINRAQARLNAWDASSGTGTASARDQASGILNEIIGLLNSVDGRHASSTVTVTRRTVFEEQRRGLTTGGPQLRWGGIYDPNTGAVHAQTGFLSAYVANQPTVHFGERATGGEAYVPKRGSYARSMGILNEAASWYGASVVAGDRRGGGATMVDNSVRVQSNPVFHVTVGEGANERKVVRLIDEALAEDRRNLARQLKVRR